MGKSALREQLLAARRSVADDVRAAEARALTEHLAAVVSSDSTVCAYVPVGGEPGSIEMLDLLLRRTGRVLLPVARTTADDSPVALQWGEYRPGQLVAARFPVPLRTPGGRRPAARGGPPDHQLPAVPAGSVADSRTAAACCMEAVAGESDSAENCEHVLNFVQERGSWTPAR